MYPVLPLVRKDFTLGFYIAETVKKGFTYVFLSTVTVNKGLQEYFFLLQFTLNNYTDIFPCC